VARSLVELVDQSLDVGIEVVHVFVRQPDRFGDVEKPGRLFSADYLPMLSDDRVDVVVELIGGKTDPAKSVVLQAIRAGKHVVTANRDLMAHHGPEIRQAAARQNVSVLTEGAVGCGLPLLRTIRMCTASGIDILLANVSSTNNVICDSLMADRADESMSDVTAYCESNLDDDVMGRDIAEKACILAWETFGVVAKPDDFLVLGIESLRAEHMALATSFGYRIRHLALLQRQGAKIGICVRPFLLPSQSILGEVSGPRNVVVLAGSKLEAVTLVGRGASPQATSSAVAADVLAAAAGAVKAREQTAAQVVSAEIPGQYFVVVDERHDSLLVKLAERVTRHESSGLIGGITARTHEAALIAQLEERDAYRPGLVMPVLDVDCEMKPRAAVEGQLR
jgi:homoserine dehydrogenase